MNYRSIATLNRQLAQWVSVLPRDLDLIVGVPRSGLLAANLLALHLNLPLTSVESYLEGRIFRGGRRHGADATAANVRRVLVIDDSLDSGGQLAMAKQRIEAANLGHDVSYAVAYLRPGREGHVDFFVEAVDVPRVFEWNIMHHALLMTCCLDIDGVLCVDPTVEDDDDGSRYERFLKTAKPLIIPSVPIGWLVTCRLEKYRGLTEQWLAGHEVQYRELVMMDYQDKAARMQSASHSAYKASVYDSTGADLFIESSLAQAISIANLSGREVFCVENREVIQPAKQANPIKPGLHAAVRADLRPATGTNGPGWVGRLQSAVGLILQVIPPGASFILVDEDQWGVHEAFAGRRPVPFTERDGQYWGPPADDAGALAELERLQAQGVEFMVFAWPAFWWLEYYVGLTQRLRQTCKCVVASDELVVFDLRGRRQRKQ